MSLAPGTMVDHYRIARPIGTGAFSTVYLANDDRLDGEVALKVLAENRALEVDARRRFVEEAQKLRRVQSPAVIDVFDVGETVHNQPYMVLEYADQGDLANWQTNLARAVTTEECLTVTGFLSEALQALHHIGLVHRDVKPHNILLRSLPGPSPHRDLHTGAVTADGLLGDGRQLLLGDLGFVKDLAQASGLTVGGGTWAFQAPEQTQRLGVVDHRADVYAASAVMAWLVIGSMPGEGETWHRFLSQSQIDTGFVAALVNGLSEAPSGRPDNIAAWQEMIEAPLHDHLATVAMPPATQRADAKTEIWSDPTTGTAIQPKRPNPHLTTGPGVGEATGHRQDPQGRTGPRVAVLAAIVGLMAGSMGLLGGVLLAQSDDAAETEVVGDTASTEVTVGDRRVVIRGPATAPVGGSVTFVALIEPPAPAMWVRPEGVLIPATDGITYLPSSEGQFSVALLVMVPGAKPLLVVHQASAVS